MNHLKVYITGAGPGDVELLTLKAYNCIKQADVILYDNLVSDEILKLNTVAEKIYVGRKFGDKANQLDRQSQINQLMEQQWRAGKSVVRLKSGDPYIYGRAAEEVRYLIAKDIPFEVVPGITAALGAANILNFPVTERNKSNALLICTAHTADYSFEQLNGIASMLKAGNTIALYMGLKSLDKIVDKLMEVCGDTAIPISAISNVSRAGQMIVSGTLSNIQEKIRQSDIQMPVVFLIGAEPITEA
jgi:uroporphyrin-III C-methyltransferase